MKQTSDAMRHLTPRPNQPTAVLGAGRLVSLLRKEGDEQSGWRYTFNIFWTNRETDEVGQLFTPDDVEQLARLARLLAFELAEEGCLPAGQCDDLACLASCLDDVLGGGQHAPAHYLPIGGGLAAAVSRVLKHVRESAYAEIPPAADRQQLLHDVQRVERWLRQPDPRSREAVTDTDRTTEMTT